MARVAGFGTNLKALLVPLHMSVNDWQTAGSQSPDTKLAANLSGSEAVE